MNPLERHPDVSPEFHEALLARLSGDGLVLPDLDEAAARVVGLSANPDADIDETAAALESCPALAERVLEVAGSALYATREPVRDVRGAAGRLGLRAVGELAVLTLVRDQLYGPLVSNQREAGELWTHAAAAGVYAFRLTRMRRRASEASILAGLLAGIGKPLLLELLRELEVAHSEPLLRTTRHELVDRLHVILGSALVRSWQLPRPVVLAVTYQNAFEEAPPGCDEAAIACLCDHLAHRLFTSDVEGPVIDHPAAQALRLTPGEVEQLLDNPSEVLEAAGALA